MRSMAAVLVLLVSFSTASAQGDDKPVPRAELEKWAVSVAHDAAVMGTDLFNVKKNPEGCFRLYQGTLMAVLPMIEHRTAVAASVKAKLAKAKTMTAHDGAFILREAIDEVLAINAPKKPLWERLGGEAAVRAVVGDFLVAIANDPKVNVTRDGKYPLNAAGVKKLEQLLVEQISSVTGGPLKYTGRDMKTTHAGMRITEDEFNAAAGHLIAVLKKYKVPDAERDELVGIIASTKKDIVDDRVMVKPADKPLWERLGGEKAVRAVVHDFVVAAAGDPKVNFTRGGKYALDADGVKKLEQLLVEQISSVSGGPLKYTGRDMKTTHAGMKITKDEFAALAGHLVKTLQTYKVPQKEIDELVGIIATTMKDIVEEK
jgi:hemoglobin